MSVNSIKTLSVIIATYNRCDGLMKTLESMLKLNQSAAFDYEIIVVDNNSTDQTKDVVESFIPKFGNKLKYVFEEKQGKACAMNEGFAEARGEIFAGTDDDCLVDEDWLINIHRVMMNGNIDILSGKVIPVFKEDPPKWLELNMFTGPYVFYDRGDQYLENDREKISVMGANMILRKSSVERFGGFGSAGRGQDVELFYKWINQGASFAYAPDVIVYHTTPPERLTKTYLRRWYFLAGRNFSQMFKEECTSGKTFLGVSLWVYRKLVDNCFKYMKGMMTLNPKRIVPQTRIYYSLGVIVGRFGWKGKSSEHLR